MPKTALEYSLIEFTRRSILMEEISREVCALVDGDLEEIVKLEAILDDNIQSLYLIREGLSSVTDSCKYWEPIDFLITTFNSAKSKVVTYGNKINPETITFPIG